MRLQLLLIFLFSILSPTSRSENVQCRDLFFQIHQLPQQPLQPLLTSRSFILNTLTGGKPRLGIPPVWSSPAVLETVMSLQGPLSAGPLNRLIGVVGKNVWQPSFWSDHVFDPLAWRNKALVEVFKPYGPWSALGPLDPKNGPLRDWHEGPYNILGTAGPLGPLGPLGLLGPNGAPQWAGVRGPDKNGEYFDTRSGKVVDRVILESSDGPVRFPIYEYYTEGFAQKLNQRMPLDTSFMLDGLFFTNQVKKDFLVQTEHNTLLTVMVLPDLIPTVNNLGFPVPHNISVRIFQDGKLLMESRELEVVNLVQLYAEAGQKLTISVERQNILPLVQNYRLIVVGDEHPERILTNSSGEFPLWKTTSTKP